MAGLAGVLFANWRVRQPDHVQPGLVGQIIIWVIVGGLGTLIGPVIGCIVLQFLTSYLGTLSQVKGFGWIDPNLAAGRHPGDRRPAGAEGPAALVADAWRWLAGLATRPRAAAAPTADGQPVKSDP